MEKVILDESLIKEVAKNINITVSQVNTVLGLLNEGNTVPFIARYRKEVTNSLDEEQIRDISKEYEYKKNLQQRKEDVIRLIDEKGMLNDELENKILSSNKLVEIEDLYRPFKEKKKTRATEAIRKGLEGLAKQIMTFPVNGTLDEIATPYINEDVVSIDDALSGAKDIIAEWISDNASFRKWVRNTTFRRGSLKTKLKKNAVDEKSVYKMYYEYEEALPQVKLYRVLAVNRAEKEKVLSVSVSIDKETILKYLIQKNITNDDSFVTDTVIEAINEGYKRLIKPSIERELRTELTEKAEDNAIHIFSENLRSLLLQPPMKGKTVLGLDPAYRTGCKLAVVDETGKMMDIDVIYPHQKYPGEKINQTRIDEAFSKTLKAIDKYDVKIIAIGNGTASRESEQFAIDVIKKTDKEVFYIIVNEAGASVYSASDLARDEFPDLHVEERSAVSIARRLQDPLSELVKIDPKSIGVGQYQHDITKAKINDSLDFVVETAVNQVGVNVNTASVSLLEHISGLNKACAKSIVNQREKIGKFVNRDVLIKVPKLSAKKYEQAIGFLRIIDGDNPLDKTRIHPESYDIATKILDYLELTTNDLGSDSLNDKLNNCDKNKIQKELGISKILFDDIIEAFMAPLRDPRDSFKTPILRSDILKLTDLNIGMELEGTVRNVVDFGAFVDCGVKEDGLVHISKISKSFIKHPLEILNVGDIIKVKVIDIDIDRHRLQLSMIDL